MKKIAICLMILTLSLMTFGCSSSQELSNSFFLQMKVDEDGIYQTIGVPTFKKQLLENYSEKQVESFISALRVNVEKKLYNNYYIKYWLRYLENPIADFVIGGDLVKFEKPSFNPETEEIEFSFNFLSQQAWLYYNLQTSSAEDGGEATKDCLNQFVVSSVSESVFPFSVSNEGEVLVGEVYLSVFKEVLAEKFPEFSLSESEFLFEYRYVTTNSRIHSNADKISETAGFTQFVWQKNFEELADQKEVKIWVNEANRGLWYLLVFVPFMTMGIICLVCLFIKSKKPKEDKKIAE